MNGGDRRSRELAGIFLRSLALQASWNPERHQNLGLAVSLLPWLRRAGASPDEARRFCRRHLEYFNTNPYTANLLIGGLVRLEADGLHERGAGLHTVTMFKDTLGRALASLGDQFFWLGLQPALMLLAVMIAAPGLPWSPLVVVGGFAIAQLAWRRWCLRKGFAAGLDIVDELASPRWHQAIWLAKRAGAVLTGVLAGLTATRLHGEVAAGSTTAAVGGLLALVMTLMLRRRWSGETLLLALLPLALALTYL